MGDEVGVCFGDGVIIDDSNRYFIGCCWYGWGVFRFKFLNVCLFNECDEWLYLREKIVVVF